MGFPGPSQNGTSGGMNYSGDAQPPQHKEKSWGMERPGAALLLSHLKFYILVLPGGLR